MIRSGTLSVHWVLVANNSFAQIYEIKGMGRDIKEIHLFENPDGRKKNGEFVSDRPGRSFDSMSPGSRHALGKKIDPHWHEVQVFIHKVVDLLRKSKDERLFTDLSIIAPPEFLGELNLTIPENIKAVINKEIPKDLPETISKKERLDLVCTYLDFWNRAP